MSNDENRPAMDEPADAFRDDAVRDLVPQPVLAAQPMSPWLEEAGFGPPVPSSGAGISAYLHALRRRWVVAAVLGVICCLLAGAAVRFTAKDRYTTTALIRVAAQEDPYFNPVMGGGTESPDAFRSNQLQHLHSLYVLEAAMRRESLAMKEAKEEGDDVDEFRLLVEDIDPAGWLAENLKTDYPGSSVFLRVRLTRDNAKEAARLVNAVIEAYMELIVGDESQRMRERRAEFDEAFTAMDNELRTLKSTLIAIIEQTVATGSSTKELNYRSEIERLKFLLQSQFKLQDDLVNANHQIEQCQKKLEDPDEVTISEAELDTLVESDYTASKLIFEQDRLLALIQDTLARGNENNPKIKELLEGLRARLSTVKQQLKGRRAELKSEREQELQRLQETAIETEMAESQAKVAFLSERLTALETAIEMQETAVDEQERLVGPDGGDSVDVKNLRDKISLKESLLATIGLEREKLIMEMDAFERAKQKGKSESHKGRITLWQPAIAPKSPDKTARVPLVIMAMIGGFFLPIVCIAWWDTRGKRINSPLEISDGLGLNVLGAVPVIPARAIGNLNGSSKRQRQWRARLDESVNGIVATLLRKAELEKTRVVLVTSAMSGEGKTTLATHLALSLARAGKRTVLVDFDLRRPAMDGVFGVPLQPGVSEMLSGSADMADLVQPTETENLSLVTAGRIDASVMATLAGGAPGVLFQRLRAEYDFVVVDGSPILPVVDARYVGQHADAVILSVLRDVSQAPKVSAAWEILVSLGIHAIGVVVTGSSEEAYYRKSGYEQTIPA